MTFKLLFPGSLRQVIPVWPALVLLLSAPTWLGAQGAVRFEAATDSREVVEGSIFEVTFSLRNAQGSRFVLPDFKGLKVVSGPSEMRGMSIVNGQSSSHQSWSFVLEATRTGTFTISPASVTANGKTLTSQPLVIQVVASRAGKGTATPPPGSDDQIFISSELDREMAYTGQQVTWRVRLYTQLSVEGADLIELPGLEGFFSREKRRFDTHVQYQTVRGKKYAVKTLHEEALFPQEAKEYTIGTAKVRAAVESSNGGGLGMLLGSRPVLLQTQAVRLKVKPLPTPAPSSFTGAVGKYEWTISADKTNLTTDDALTLTISVEGNGDANRVAAPVIAGSDSLEVFEPKITAEEWYENMEQFVHSKTLEYVLLPKEPGSYTIQPSFSFFDPDSNRFVLRTAQKIEFQVTAGKNYQPRSAQSDTLFVPAPIEPAPSQAWFESPVLWWSAGGLLVLVLLWLVFRKKRQKDAPATTTENIVQPMVFPAQKNFHEYFGAIPALLRSGDSRAFYDTLLKSVQHYLTENAQLPPSRMNIEAARQRLQEYRTPELLINTVLEIWDICEKSIYAGQDNTSAMGAVWNRAELAFRELDQVLRRGEKH